MKDPVTYFKNVQIIHFDMIHHQCRGDPLKMPLSYYQTLLKKNQKKSLFLQQLEIKDKQNNHFF